MIRSSENPRTKKKDERYTLPGEDRGYTYEECRYVILRNEADTEDKDICKKSIRKADLPVSLSGGSFFTLYRMLEWSKLQRKLPFQSTWLSAFSLRVKSVSL